MLKLHRGRAPTKKSVFVLSDVCFSLRGFDAMVAHYRMCVNIWRFHHVYVHLQSTMGHPGAPGQ